ncbi:MAG: GAF domain-containing protein, partial [Opitutae bacterium]
GGLTMMALPTATVFLALGAALVGTAVRRQMSAHDRAPQPFDRTADPTWIKLLLIFAVLSAGIIATGAVYYRNFERRYRSEMENQLSAIADLKVGELIQWRRERMGDAGLLFKNAAISDLVRRTLEKPEDAVAAGQLAMWLEKYITHMRYDRVRLLDAQGTTRLSWPRALPAPSADVLEHAAEALRSGQVMLHDFYRGADDQRVRLSLSIPVYAEADGGRPLGVIVLRINPEYYLYPLIERWPTASPSAETLLVRKEGNDVIFLNELRFRKDAPLTIRIPLDQVDVPAVQAVLGRQGVMDGSDYRGVRVVAALRTIPDSPWALVARIDYDEVFAPLQQQRWNVVGAISLLLLGTGAGVGLVWRRRHDQFNQSERKMMRALQESENLLNETGRIAQIGGWMIELSTQTLRWTAEVYALHEVAPGFQPTVESVMNFYAPESRPIIQQAVARAIQSGEAFDLELEVITARQRRIAVQVAGHVEFEKGEAKRVVGIFQDITQRKQAQAALTTEKQNLDAIFESSPVALFILDAATHIIRVNTAGVALTGGSAAAALHHRPGNALSCMHAADDPRGCGYGPACPLCPVRNGIEALLANGGTLHGAELPLELIRNGAPEQVWMAIGAETVQIDGHRHLCVAMEDITARIQAAAINTARLHLIEFAAAHSLDELLEETLNEAEKLSGSVIGFYHFVEADQATLTLQNWSTRTKAEFCRAAGKGSHYSIDQAGVWADCVRQRKPVIHNDYAALPNRKGLPEGHAMVIRELVVPVMQGEQVMAILGVGNKPGNYTAVDVTVISELAGLAWQIAVRKRAEEEVHRLNAELEQRVAARTAQLALANRELEAFSHSVSHDLRAPLRSIDGFSRIILEDYAAKLDEEGRDNLARIRAATQRMGHLIDDMLKLSRVSRSELRWEPVDLAAIAREVVADLRQREPARAGDVIVADGLVASGDAHLLRIVLENLLGNAWKFTGKCAAPRIEMGVMAGDKLSTLNPQPSTPTFFIRDNGAGFDPTYAGKLFGAFQRLHSNADFPGSGIGLATVQRVIHRHGGRIWAEARVGQGATFYFTLDGNSGAKTP